MTPSDITSVFAGDLDVDDFKRVRVFLSSEHEPGSDELELDVYYNRIRLVGYTDSVEVFTYELTWEQLAELAAITIEE
jgi:hypothetical protein